MAGHAQLKFVMTECSKTQIRLARLICKASSFLALISHGLKLMNIKLSEKLNCGFGGKSELHSDF